jgi:hypothetical protein
MCDLSHIHIHNALTVNQDKCKMCDPGYVHNYNALVVHQGKS